MNLRFGRRSISASMKICTNIIMPGDYARHHIAGDGMNIIAWIAGPTFRLVCADLAMALAVGLIFAGERGMQQIGERQPALNNA